ncbi:hypothetical protein BGX27_004549 [Mortierella sp. AM989]|nr:hypothetical protein BGX27_004549 [Mortierella sp. AM989]
MDKKPAGKFSLDSLMSRVLPSLDINVPPVADGSKKFKRVRPVEGAVTMTTAGYVNMNPTVAPVAPVSTTVSASIPAVAPASAPTQQKPAVGATLVSGSKPNIPSDMAAAAASLFSEPAIATATTTTATAGSTKKNRRGSKKRKGGSNSVSGEIGAEPSIAAGSIQSSSESGVALNVLDHSRTEKPQQKNNRKRKKGQHTNSQHGTNNEGGNRSESKQQHDGKQKKTRRKLDPQSLVRNLDATPELVGVSADDDFSTLLVKHVEHSNKMLQRDLEKQSKMMMEEQKKQARLLASQAAQLSDPQAASPAQPQQQQQQQQQQKKPNLNNPKTPFVPRKDCIYFLKGFCRNEGECTFRHDVEARNAHQAQLNGAGPSTAGTSGAGGNDLAQAEMYAM